MTATTLGEIHAALGGDAMARLVGPADLPIERIAPLHAAGPEAISFVAQARFASQLEHTRAGCVIVAPALQEQAQARGAVLVTADPYRYYAALTRWWAARTRTRVAEGVHPSACVAPGVTLGPGVSIGPMAVVEAGASLAAGVQIGAHAHVGEGVQLGEATRLAPRVTLMPGTRVGARGLFNSGAVIGADGFGFAPGPGGWEKIEQLGGVWIGDDVEIGANTCVDRGALEDTVIEHGVKLDNLIQIAHNVRIGERTAMAGCVGVAGSTRIGRQCTFGGAAMILGHLEIADHVNISAASVVMSSIRKPGTYSGIFPLDDNAAWEKNAATLRQLHTLRDRLRALERKQNDMDIHQILKKLPHRYPILLVDRVLEFEKNKSIKALKNVTINEPFFMGHFPHRPVMPGVLTLEALAQASALLSFMSFDTDPGEDSVVYFVGIDGARFKRPVEPGDQLILESSIERAKAGIYKYKARASVAGETAVEAELMCTMRKVA